LGLEVSGREQGKGHIVSTQIEHSSVLEPLVELERRGFEVTRVPPDSGGRVDAGAVAGALRRDTLLVSVMHANNETGVIQPIAEIAEALGDREVFYHVDAAQTFGKIIEPLRHPRIDLISMSGHKLFAPKGIGALIARRRGRELPPLKPILFGGGQELGLRPGTLPVALIAGLGEAAELAVQEADQRADQCRQIRAQLLAAISALRPVIHGHEQHGLPHVVNVSFPGVHSDDAIEALEGIAAVSNGSACTSVCQSSSHVLAAMGVPPDEAQGALRFSWCHLTQLDKLDRMMEVLGRLQGRG
jgi:cysteine desulfurase